MAAIKCIVVTPEDTALEKDSSFVVAPLFDGEIGISPGRSPLIGRLGYGELRVTDAAGHISRYYVDGGFIQVADNTVSLLTGRLVPAADLKLDEISKQLDEANKRLANSEELIELRDRAVLQARAQMMVAQRANR